MKQLLSVIALCLGLLLLAASFAWGMFFPATRSWTEEKSARMAEIGGEVGRLKASLQKAQTAPSMHSGQNPAEMKARMDQLSAEYESLHKEFTGAVDAPKSSAKFLRWAGIAFVVAGGLVVYASRGA